jgi:hypothetical protein
MTTQTAPVKAFEVEDDSLLTKVKEVAHESNIRRIRILYKTRISSTFHWPWAVRPPTRRTHRPSSPSAADRSRSQPHRT